jgi:urease subunit gamma/beta
MRLTQTELDRVTIFNVAEMARRRRARGLRLNHPEAAALITDEMMELARDGASYEAVRARGGAVLTEADVLPGVPALLRGLRCEPQFDDGPRLIVLASPIAPGAEASAPGGVEAAGPGEAAPGEAAPGEAAPGEVVLAPEPIEINAGREVITIRVHNASDHVVNVSSHYHFYEVNPRLEFDRSLTWGRHLDIQAGRSLIWRPGETREVALVPFAGSGRVDGFQGAVPPGGPEAEPPDGRDATPPAGRRRG